MKRPGFIPGQGTRSHIPQLRFSVAQMKKKKSIYHFVFVVVRSLGHVWLCNPMDCSMPRLSVLYYLLEFAQIPGHWVRDAIQPSHPLSPSSPPALSLSQHQSLFSESALCIKLPKYWSFSFGISASYEYSELISFKIDWFDLLAIQGTLRSLL